MPEPRITHAERFLSKVDTTGDCWQWRDTLNRGYGQFFIGPRHYGAHRWAYLLLVGPVPPGMRVRQRCKNRACVRPSHLELATYREIIMDTDSPLAVNAAKTSCPAGHPYDDANTYVKPGDGSRTCRTCHRERSREDMRRKRAAARQAAIEGAVDA